LTGCINFLDSLDLSAQFWFLVSLAVQRGAGEMSAACRSNSTDGVNSFQTSSHPPSHSQQRIMSRKHFFPSPEGVVHHMLNSLVTRNPFLGLDAPNRVVYNTAHPPNQVTIISGGGSGHEPAWSGFVGDGMLSAAVCGDIFASPSTKQIMAGIRNVPSNEGVILCITNYTGDMLHFGLAREKGQALGYKVDVVCMAEDAALGREKSEKVGRRGLAGNLLGESCAMPDMMYESANWFSYQAYRRGITKRVGVRTMS
jgi:hypothetical protein